MAVCVPTKEDLLAITGNRSEVNKLHMVEELRAHFLIKGAIVKVRKEDARTGMAEIQSAGFTTDLWTYNKLLSRHPIKDAFGVIEAPKTSGLIPAHISAKMGALAH